MSTQPTYDNYIELLMAGFKDSDIADMMGISYMSLHHRKRDWGITRQTRHIERAKRYADMRRRGLNDGEIADEFGMTFGSLRTWLSTHKLSNNQWENIS